MATKIRIILVTVLMAATFLCSCRSKESVTKEISLSQAETHLSLKDSATHSSTFVSSDTAYSNEETTIHQVVYDTEKRDSSGNCPILSITDVNTKKHSGSKGKKEQTSILTKVENIKQIAKQKNIDKKNNSNKIASQLKEAKGLIHDVLFLAVIMFVIILSIKYRINILSFIIKKLPLIK